MLSNLRETIRKITSQYLFSTIVGCVVCVFFVNFYGWLYVKTNNIYFSFFSPLFLILSMIIAFLKEDLKIEQRIRIFVFWTVVITLLTLSILWFFNLFNSVSPNQPPATLIEQVVSFLIVAIVLQLSVIPSILLFHRLKK